MSEELKEMFENIRYYEFYTPFQNMVDELRRKVEEEFKTTRQTELEEFIHFLVSEECEGCTDCNPFSDIRACYVEGRAKWYVCMLYQFVKETKQ